MSEHTNIRALSWKQPYAELMLHGKIETRTWNTNYRGKVLICASLQSYSDKEINSISGKEQHKRIRSLLMPYFLQNCVAYRGYAIAIAELIECRPMKKEDEDSCFVKFNPSLFVHIYKNVKKIEPFRWKGTQGWKSLTPDLLDKINII